MDIILLRDPVTTTQDIDFELGDNGSAFVSLTLIICDASGIKIKLVHDEQYSGALKRSLHIERGAYSCTFIAHAFKQGALGPVYDSYLNISGSKVAFTTGSIAKGYEDDLGYKKFALIIA